MTRRRYPRSATPPPIKDPIVENDEENDSDGENGNFDWYYGADAGGMILNFGKNRGQRINQTSISYLYWCFRNFRYNHPVLQAFRIYHAGLVEYAKTAYRDFVVPFGWTYKGKTICQCRDKRWLLWTIRQKVLTDKYTIFFIAVQHWLDNPRHYEVTRDVGELLCRSEYADGIDLLGTDEYEDEEDPTITDDVDDENKEDAYDYDDDESTQADLDFINDGPVEDGVPSEEEEEEFEHAGPSFHSPSRSSETRKKPKTKKSRKMRSAESRKELDMNFIVPDDSDDEAPGSEDYFTSDTELNHESPMRITRSATKKMADAVKGRETPVSPTRSRIPKRGKRSNSAALCYRNSDRDDGDHIPKSNASGRSHQPMVVSDDEEEDDTLPSFNIPRHDKKTLNRKKRTGQSTKEDSDSEVEFVEPLDVCLGPSRGLESPNSGNDEGEGEEEVASPLKHSRVMLVTSPPESDGEMDEEEDGNDGRREVPVTPRSRFLGRKRVVTSDSEADEVTVTVVRSPRKKGRVNPKVSSFEIEVKSDQDVMFTPDNRNKISRCMKGKRNAKVLEVNDCTYRPLTPAQVQYIVQHELKPASTPRDHRRGSPYSSPSKSHRSWVTE